MEITYLGEHILQWHITHRCNLRCAHCYQSEYASEMSGEELFPALDKYERFLEEKHLHGHINLTGGEPLVHPDFFILAREIRRRNMDLGILTNGTLIDREKAKLIAELRPLFVQVSLDGTRRIHNAVRGSGSFERAMRGIDWLKKEGVSVHVSFTAQRTNLNQLRPLARVCRVHKVDKLWFDRVVITSDEDRSRLSLTTDEYKKLVETAGKKYKGWRTEGYTRKQRNYAVPCKCSCSEGLFILQILREMQGRSKVRDICPDRRTLRKRRQLLALKHYNHQIGERIIIWRSV